MVISGEENWVPEGKKWGKSFYCLLILGHVLYYLLNKLKIQNRTWFDSQRFYFNKLTLDQFIKLSDTCFLICKMVIAILASQSLWDLNKIIYGKVLQNLTHSRQILDHLSITFLSQRTQTPMTTGPAGNIKTRDIGWLWGLWQIREWWRLWQVEGIQII